MREATTTTARQVIGKTYLSITDVQTVLGMTREPARILFQKVKAREKEKLGEFDVWPNMIQKENLLKAIPTLYLVGTLRMPFELGRL